MTIPTSSNFPTELDTDNNLYEVHDSLRVRLAEDYAPGDTVITVSGDEETMRRFPDTGIITLTEQCSEAENRAISFYYGMRSLTTFEELELLPGFTDVAKPKSVTNVTQNVMASTHNAIKDAIIAIQYFAGKKGEIGMRPLDGTMEARTNYIRKLALSPKAWFSVNKTVGLVPMTCDFQDLSFRLGDGDVRWIWDFGDNTSPSLVTVENTTIEATDVVPVDSNNVLVDDTDGGSIQKTYTRPGVYDVKLTVINEFGQDTVIFPGLINSRIKAPDEAVIKFLPRTSQIHIAGTPTDGPYTTPPTIRAPANSLIDIEIQSGTNPNTGRSYGGEELDDSGSPLDPISQYTWSLADDLTHNNASAIRASYSVGGKYDLILRTDTAFGAYRITTYEDVIDIVEKTNLWLWTFGNSSVVNSYEFGLTSETFKAKAETALTVGYNDEFLDGEDNESQQKIEFSRNNGFAQRGTTGSGNGGSGLLFWASGRGEGDPTTDETIQMSEFNGFSDTYISRSSISRPWNWVSLSSPSKLYFLFGGITSTPGANESPTNQTKTTVTLSDLSIATTTLANTNYKNGANELKENEVSFDDAGNPEQGHMSVYRACWRNDTGYILRNEGVGTFFRLKSFYKTSGNTSDQFIDLRKLPDMTGPAKTEGQLVALRDGVFFFNNSGAVSAYNSTSGVWESGGPGINSAAFRLLQDNTASSFDDTSNTLLAASDGDQLAYLSYDYSVSAFTKFNLTDMTFSKLGSRPAGNQWQMMVF